MERFLLFILDGFRPLFRLMRVDYVQLRAILTVKLTMDARRPTVGMSRNMEGRNVFGWTLFFYAIMGGLVGFMIAELPFLFATTLFFSYIMVMVAMTLILDFSTVLLDTSDNTIILPRPVDSRTFYTARIVHILMYLGLLSLSLSFFSFIAVGYRYSVSLMIVTMVSTLLSTLMSVFFTALCYLLVMRFSSEEKLKSIINYIQIIMAVVFMGAYQLMGRVIPLLEGRGELNLEWWNYFVPPFWMSGTLEGILHHHFELPQMILVTLAIGMPLFLAYATFTWLTPLFNRNLVSMAGTTGKSGETPRSSSRRADQLSKFFSRKPLEQASLALVYRMLGRDSKLKLKIYPTLGYVFIFGFVFMFNGKESFATIWENLPTTRYFVLLIYLPVIVSQTALREIAFTDDYKASWIYLSAPIDRPGEILSGTVKAMMVKLVLPLYAVLSIMMLFIFGSSVTDDLLVGLLNNYLIILMLALLSARHLPLSLPPNLRNQTGNLLRGLIVMLATGLPALLHYLLTFIPWALFLVVPLQLALIYYLHQVHMATTWNKIKS